MTSRKMIWMAILRRTTSKPPVSKQSVSSSPAQPASEAVISHGDLQLDPQGWFANWRGQDVTLTVTEFSILRTLITMPGKIFSRDVIIGRLHGPGFAITDRTIDSHVRNLRHKFADAGCDDLIETRAGVGYRIGACEGRATNGTP